MIWDWIMKLAKSKTPAQDIFRPSHPSAQFIKIRHIENVIVPEFHVSTFHTASRLVRPHGHKSLRFLPFRLIPIIQSLTTPQPTGTAKNQTRGQPGQAPERMRPELAPGSDHRLG